MCHFNSSTSKNKQMNRNNHKIVFPMMENKTYNNLFGEYFPVITSRISTNYE